MDLSACSETHGNKEGGREPLIDGYPVEGGGQRAGATGQRILGGSQAHH